MCKYINILSTILIDILIAVFILGLIVLLALLIVVVTKTNEVLGFLILCLLFVGVVGFLVYKHGIFQKNIKS